MNTETNKTHINYYILSFCFCFIFVMRCVFLFGFELICDHASNAQPSYLEYTKHDIQVVRNVRTYVNIYLMNNNRQQEKKTSRLGVCYRKFCLKKSSTVDRKWKKYTGKDLTTRKKNINEHQLYEVPLVVRQLSYFIYHSHINVRPAQNHLHFI